MLRLSFILKSLLVVGAISLAACSSQKPLAPATNAPSSSDQGNIESEQTNGPKAGSQEDLAVQAGADRVFFAFDSYDLTPEARNTLRRQADWLKKYPQITVTIEGHSDERGTREYNLALGDRRATAAKNYLVALGIPTARISTISYGKERPAVVGSNEEAWAQNRRAVMTVN